MKKTRVRAEPKKKPKHPRRQEQEELALALAVLEEKAARAPLCHYRPHTKQLAFHDSAKRFRRRAVFAPNRWGKTVAGCHEALAHAYGYRYWEIPDLTVDPETQDLPRRDQVHPKYWIHRLDQVPLRIPNVGLVVSGLARERGIGQVIWPEFRKWLPPALFASGKIEVRSSQDGPKWCVLPNGSRIHFGSGSQSPDQFEAFHIDWAWVDEPINERIYNGIWRGLTDYYGPIWFTLTPLGAECLWMADWVRDAQCWTNPPTRQHDNPYLSEAARKEFAKDGRFTKRERRARLFGEFEFLGGKVFEAFDPQVHAIQAFPIPAHWPQGLTVDPHHRRPAFCLWWALDPHSEPNWIYHFFREWPLGDFFEQQDGALTPPEYAALFRGIEAARPVDYRICDPRFGKSEVVYHGKSESSWAEMMHDCGLDFDTDIEEIGRIETGHVKIQRMLHWDRNFPLSPTNTPRIFVHDTCPNLLTAFERYAFEDIRDPDKGYTEKVSERYKDPIDAVRYTVLWQVPYTGVQVKNLGMFSDDDLEQENSAY